MNQTTLTKNETVTHNWHITSAKGEIIGDLAVKIATVLMGKNKVDWTPTTDAGDFVVVTDVEGLTWTREKEVRKTYKFHSGYVGGITELSLGVLHARKPEKVLELAVKRMLPKTIQASHQLKRLKIYKGAAHPHASQSPKPLV